MKQIGEFAYENQVTIKALHHYEKLGLIRPARVDEFTGYRYYEESQSKTLRTITHLKSLGFSLSGIKEVLDAKTERTVFMNRLYAKKKQAEMDIDSSQLRYRRIAALLATLEKESGDDKFDIEEMINMQSENILTKMSGHEKFNYMSWQMFDNAKKSGSPLCALCIDIDRFKSVNDNYGYDVGDTVIESIMDAALSCLTELNPGNTEGYSIMERLSGDEFRIMVKDTAKACGKLAQNILDSVKAIDFSDVADGLKMTVSIGIASTGSGELSASHLFHLAESALYEAKSKEKGTYLIYTE
jgi:diguanylate cyclase (GGDEF)-like protein